MGRYKYWQTKSGERVPINKMTTEHLLNTVRLIDRVAKQKWAFSVGCSNPFQCGTMADYEFDQQQDYMIEEGYGVYLPDIYWDMRTLLLKQGVDIEKEIGG